MFVHRLKEQCNSTALINTLSAGPQHETNLFQKRIQRALEEMLTSTPHVPDISGHGEWVVPSTLFLLFSSGKYTRQTVICPVLSKPNDEVLTTSAITVSELEATGVVYFHEATGRAAIPHPMMLNLLKHNSFEGHPLRELTWLWLPDRIMSAEDNELVTLCVLAGRLHFGRLFGKRPTLGDLLPPLRRVAKEHSNASVRKAAHNLAAVSVACSVKEAVPLCPSIAKADTQITRKTANQVWTGQAKGSSQGCGLVNVERAPFAHSVLWANAWALFVQDKQSVVARRKAQTGKQRASESADLLEDELQKIFQDGRPLKPCKTQLFVVCTDKQFADDVYCVPQGRLKRLLGFQRRTLLVLHAQNQQHVFGMFWELKQRRVETSRASALEIRRPAVPASPQKK